MSFFNFLQKTQPNCRLRLAPTPSGFLHIGNGLNFVLNWLVARHTPSGRLLLRIDDMDADRKRPEYVSDVFQTLHWLGLDWDEGPRSPEDFEKNWSQRHRMAAYELILRYLREKNLLFACGKSRRELAPFAPNYPKNFREQGLSLDAPDLAWRIQTPPELALADFVVRRRDTVPAYQIASLADDIFFNITDIVRGADLQPSTEAQLFLAQMIDNQTFLKINFWHHPLLRDANGEKLSKSAGAISLKTMRESGLGPGLVFEKVANMIGIEKANTADGLLNNLRGATLFFK